MNTCPRCHRNFKCSAEDEKPCWCFSLPKLELKNPQLDCFCPSCLAELTQQPDSYLDENGNTVFNSGFLFRRGYCCNNGCKNCPF